MQRFPISLGAVALVSTLLAGQTPPPADEYRIYAGSTHAHTAFTWSHGAHLATNGCAGILAYAAVPSSGADAWSEGYVRTDDGCPAIFVINGAQIHAPGVTVKPDWPLFQGPPSAHFAAARAAGYDFYASTDHSQEAGLQSPAPASPRWLETERQAAAASDDHFAGLRGFEYSENDGPGGTGHINVINSADILNALVPGVDLAFLYDWLVTAAPNGDGPVVASFNHPGPDQYDNWGGRTGAVTDALTMLEVINSNTRIHYDGFVNALDHGWKVAPVAGNDNHGLGGIARQTSRTFVLAEDNTKAAILDAMRHRRTYASLDTNIQARYAVNGSVMGSTLTGPQQLRFDIAIADPDTTDPGDRITKIDIVSDGGTVVQTYTPAAAHSIRWTTTVDSATETYFFVRVWSSGGGDAPDADAAAPVAWLAPVWTGR